MKKIITIFIFVLFSCAAGSFVSAQEVRVGLLSRVNEATRVNISGSSISVSFETNGNRHERAVLQGTGFFFLPDRGFYVRTGSTFSTFSQASTAAQNANEISPAVPTYVGNGVWVLYFGRFDTEQQAAAFAATMSAQTQRTIVSGNRRISLSDNSGLLMLFDSPYSFPQITVPGEETFFVDGGRGLGRYRGRLELGRFRGNNITGVNVLSMNEYLYSVVPSEMPHSWHSEALKAQAVASRTFASRRIGHHSSDGFDLCDTTCCQVFIGANNEAASTTAAVRATTGIMIWHNGRPISANFFSSSGGHTESSENAWVTAYPFLRGVPDPYETTGLEWTRTFTFQQLTSLAANRNIGTVTGVSLNRNSNGRVQQLVLSGTAGTATINGGNNVRTFFSGAGGSLPSNKFILAGEDLPQNTVIQIATANGLIPFDLRNAFVLNNSNSPTPLSNALNQLYVLGGSTSSHLLDVQQTTPPQTPGQITFIGTGHGHGVGMSQHGAHGMARAGYSFIEILKWYYTGVEVR